MWKARGDIILNVIKIGNRCFCFNLSALKLVMPVFFSLRAANPRTAFKRHKKWDTFFQDNTKKVTPIAWGMCSDWGRPRSGNQPRRDGKYTWIMFEHLTGFLRLLIQYCLCRLTVVPCYWKAKRRSQVTYGCVSFSLAVGKNTIFDCVRGSNKNPRGNYIMSQLLYLKELCIQFVFFFLTTTLYVWCDIVALPAAEWRYWLVIHSRTCVMFNTKGFCPPPFFCTLSSWQYPKLCSQRRTLQSVAHGGFKCFVQLYLDVFRT